MLSLHHSSERIVAAPALITTRAKELKAAGGETRTLAQLEADVAVDLLTGIDSGGRTVEVHLTIPATTLARQDNQPGDVDGLPITADRWRWLRTNPHTGQVIDLTSPRYEPPASLATFIKCATAPAASPAVPAAPAVRHRPSGALADRGHL